MVKLEYLFKYTGYRNEYMRDTRTVDIRDILKIKGSNIESRDYPFKTVVYYWIGYWYPIIEDIIYCYEHNYQQRVIYDFKLSEMKDIYRNFKILFNIMTNIHEHNFNESWYNLLKLLYNDVSKLIILSQYMFPNLKIRTKSWAMAISPKKIHYIK